jgi:Protein of unknown function (DUF3102)
VEAHVDVELASLAEAANREHSAGEAAYASAVDHAIAAGEALLAAKGQVQYGQWLGWVDDHFHGSRRTAQVYMRMARNADVGHLAGQSSIKQALEAIPEPDRVVVVDPPHTGDPLAALRSAFLNPESTRFNDEEARRLLGGESP